MNHIEYSFPWQEPVLVFSLSLLIILMVPILLGRLKIPSIIGFILMGIVIGKHGFNIISHDSGIKLFETIGLLYLMFIAGLEIDLNEFIKNKIKGLVFGILTVLIPILFGFSVFYWVLNYSLAASILIGGIFASHTIVTYPLISKLGITKNLAVNLSIAGTLIADVTALLILAVVVNNINTSVEIFYWIKFVISIFIFGVVVLMLLPVVSRWFFKKISDNILQYIFVLTIVFLSSFLAMVAGLEPIVGAFFAGLSLNRLIPRTSPLMNRVEFIGNAIFIPFFLIGVGMIIDYKVLFQSAYSLLIILIMSAVAILSKYIAALSTQKIFKLSKSQGLLIFGLTNARVAAALAITLVGYELTIGQTNEGDPVKLLDENIFNGVVIMILITSTISSFITQNAGRHIVEHEINKRSRSQRVSEENTLIGLANEATAENLIQLAISSIERKKENRVFGLHIITKKNENNKNINLAEKLISKAENFASSVDMTLNPIIRYDLNIASGIINTIKERQIHHFFMGLHQKASILDSFFGNLTKNLLQKCDSIIYITKMFQPINTINQYIIVLSTRAHMEKRFFEWFNRVVQLSINTGCELKIIASEETKDFIEHNIKTSIDYIFIKFHSFENTLKILKKVHKNKMIVFNMADKNCISYNVYMEDVGKQIVKRFNHTNFMLVYPNSIRGINIDKQFITNASLIENVKNIGNSIHKIFKKH